jgi:hypothetical protein
MNVEIKINETNEAVGQAGRGDLEARNVNKRQVTIHYSNRSRGQFFEDVSKIKIVVKENYGWISVFRMSNGGRWWSCPLCVRWKECPILGPVQEMVRDIRVLECPYFTSSELSGDNSGINQTKQNKEIFSFAQLVTKIIKSNPIVLEQLK